MSEDEIPSMEQCYQLMKEHMLPNIYEHSLQVTNVAKMLIRNLKSEVIINERLIVTASLLHDIAKTKSIKTREPHDLSGAQFIRVLGFNKVADIIEEHIILKNFNPAGDLLEKEIVYYADKRVMHEKIVPVQERMNDIMLRYGKNPEIIEKIIKNTAMIIEVEKKINNFSVSDVAAIS